MEDLYVGGKASGPTCWNDERLFEPVDGGGWLSLDDASDFAVGVDGGVLVSRGVLPGYPDYGKERHDILLESVRLFLKISPFFVDHVTHVLSTSGQVKHL